jgi:hypothetical protein
LIALLVVETVVLAVLTVLVAGLLRAYGTVLRRLHALDGGRPAQRPFAVDHASSDQSTEPVGSPSPRETWSAAADVTGQSVTGELVSTQVVGVEHDTVLLFLSSGCSSCDVFWRQLAGGVSLPPTTRLLVVVQGPEFDDPQAVAERAPRGIDVIVSTEAWRDYEVPGSPHVVYVDGRTGRVRGEGTGQSWSHVADLLARASGDPRFVGGAPRLPKPDRDAEVEALVDRELLAAGILPGDARLYGSDELATDR